ncbi:ADNP2 isoform 4, partial [Pongo abelii]
LVDIGLDSCKELLKDLKGFDPGEKYFHNTSWGDVSLWEPSGKKVLLAPSSVSDSVHPRLDLAVPSHQLLLSKSCWPWEFGL